MSCDYCLHCRKLMATRWRDSADEIVDLVCRTFSVRREELMQFRGSAHVSFARQVAFFLIRNLSSASFPAIGVYFQKDHSTVMYGCAQIKERMEKHPETARLIAKMSLRVGTKREEERLAA